MDKIDRTEIEGQKTTYRSPSLVNAPDAPKTLCANCPLARWYWRSEWNCFCSEFKAIIYDEQAANRRPVLACDARELEITRLSAEK